VYNSFYKFAEAPFNITPDPRYLYLSAQHQEALNHLLYGVQQRKGFLQLTGEVGSGKTTVCRALFDALGDRYSTAVVLNPMLTESQLLRAIVREFGIDKPARDRLRNYELLNEFLLAGVAAGRDAVLVIDEAQDLAPSLLELVRLLSNLETNNQKLIQIILAGQPELRAKLDDPALRQLRQRITIRYHLRPLSERDTVTYIRHRIHVAGGNGLPSFDDGAIRELYSYSGGIPRLINALADKSLLAGYVKDTKHITCELVRLARTELEGQAA